MDCVWQDGLEAKGGLILEHCSPVHLPGSWRFCALLVLLLRGSGERDWKLSTKPLLLLKTLECLHERPVMVIHVKGTSNVVRGSSDV